MSQEQQLKQINEKLLLLIKQYENKLRENDKLRDDVSELRQKEEALKNKITFLEQQVIVLKTSTGKMDEADKRDLEKRLNHYLKEIDRCISMLSE